jgi:hypothetical protein
LGSGDRGLYADGKETRTGRKTKRLVNKKLILLRTFLGLKPLKYHERDERIITKISWSSTLNYLQFLQSRRRDEREE